MIAINVYCLTLNARLSSCNSVPACILDACNQGKLRLMTLSSSIREVILRIRSRERSFTQYYLSVGKQEDKLKPVRRSQRMPKRHALDLAIDDEEEDDEIRYLERLNTSKPVSGYKDDADESRRRHPELSRVSEIGTTNGKYEEYQGNRELSRSSKGGKLSGSDKPSADEDYGGQDSDRDYELEGRKNQRKSFNAFVYGETLGLTTRQRARQAGTNPSLASDSSLQFTNGLPIGSSRKQRETLTEAEQKQKKVEAAQRRTMQREKAAQEAEAEAIRKILGQESGRAKREKQKKKQKKELAQEKAANSQRLASSTIKWIMRPSGTLVMFPEGVSLPSIFDSKPCCYPPPREKCAGPSCTNPYKYRDSKSKLPLCSLQCYKAVQVTISADVNSTHGDESKS